jgi:hypothetical protein
LKLYPNTPNIFYIPKTPDGHNAQRLKSQLERADCFQSEIVIGLFDFDSEGYNQLNGLTKDTWNPLDTNTSKCFFRKNKIFNFYGLLLPTPNHRINYASDKLKSNSILSIELLFTDTVLGENIEDEQIPGTDQTRKKFKDSKKMSFANTTKDLNADDFKYFKPIFETIEKILKT